MNDPLRMATTRRSFGLAAAISRASASVRSAIDRSSYRTLTCLSPLMASLGERRFISRRGEFYQHVANPGRWLRQTRPEGNPLMRTKTWLRLMRRPEVEFATIVAAQRN